MIDHGHRGRVQDVYGRVGILRDIDPAWEDPSDPPGGHRRQVVAFISPERGGSEWHADPTTVTRMLEPARAGLRGAESGHEPIGGR